MSPSNTLTNGTNGLADLSSAAVAAAGVREATETRARGWFTRAVTRYMRRNLERLRSAPTCADQDIPDRARRAIRKAALVSAGGGALTGAISTAATVVTAQTEGLGGFVAVPIAGAAIGLEMVWRSAVHVRLTCDLAHLFQVRFDADDTDDLLRLYALVFGTHKDDESEKDFGKGMLEKVTEAEGEDVGERIGHALLGESVMRNVVPVLGIFTSAITNYVVTRRLGDTVRRYLRYQRAMTDAIRHAELTCERSKLLLIEGMWFIFTADGVLAPEEAGCLVHLLADLPPDDRDALRARFTDDEIDWMGRVKEQVPEDQRDAFLYALEVAACLDKEISLPERKILKRVSILFQRPFEPERLTRMIEQLEDKGVLTAP
jgi:uncharacterized tellurite resistance protein B-like protein